MIIYICKTSNHFNVKLKHALTEWVVQLSKSLQANVKRCLWLVKCLCVVLHICVTVCGLWVINIKVHKKLPWKHNISCSQTCGCSLICRIRTLEGEKRRYEHLLNNDVIVACSASDGSSGSVLWSKLRMLFGVSSVKPSDTHLARVYVTDVVLTVKAALC